MVGEIIMTNTKILKYLEYLALYYDLSGDVWRTRAYNNAINIIQSYDKQIRTYEQALKLPGIGKSIAGKIKIILDNPGKPPFELLSDIQYKKLDAYSTFMNIYGFGKKFVKTLFDKNIYSIPDLKEAVKYEEIQLNNIQKLGLKYYHDMQHKIPRNEITKITSIFKRVAKKIDKDLILMTVGSYRRGLKESGDIDILLAHPNVNKISKNNYLKTFIDILKESKTIHLIDLKSKSVSLSVRKTRKEAQRKPTQGSTRYKYISTEFLIKTPLSPYYRKLDIKYYPYDSFYTALMYFTGSRSFNIKMRKLAKRKGYQLSDYGLYKITNEGLKEKIDITSEEDIFDELDVKYIPPRDRY